MEISYLIIGVLVLFLLRSIALNQKTICKNQVSQGQLLQELIDKINKK